MSFVAQASVSRFRGTVGAFRPVLLLAACALPLAACASGGYDLSRAEVDDLTRTGAVPAANQAADPTRVSDETTIRNAVSAADPEQSRVQPLAWANANTGSRGSITNLVEKRQDGTLCRAFTASRESFDGVALYAGDACKANVGDAWYMRSFKPL